MHLHGFFRCELREAFSALVREITMIDARLDMRIIHRKYLKIVMAFRAFIFLISASVKGLIMLQQVILALKRNKTFQALPLAHVMRRRQVALQACLGHITPFAV